MHYQHPIIAHSLTREQVRRVDQRAIDDYGMSGLVLMENAASGAAEKLATLAQPQPTLILCGKGNNAGDGFAIARHLQVAGWPVMILLAFPHSQLSGDALANWRINDRAEIPMETVAATTPDDLDKCTLDKYMAPFGILLDCLLGTGSTGHPRFPLDQIITAANRQIAMKIAIDLPSGLECDSGIPGIPCFRADHTLTFVAAKRGFANEQARPFLGKIHVIGIGVPKRLLDQSMPQEIGPLRQDGIEGKS